MGADLRSGLRLSFMEAVKGATKNVTVTYVTIGQVRALPAGCWRGVLLSFVRSWVLRMLWMYACLPLSIFSPIHHPHPPPPAPAPVNFLTIHHPHAQDGRPTRKTKAVTVDVPPGVDTGVSIRMAGQGGEGRGSGAQAGNLYLTVEVRACARVSVLDARAGWRDVAVMLLHQRALDWIVESPTIA